MDAFPAKEYVEMIARRAVQCSHYLPWLWSEMMDDWTSICFDICANLTTHGNCHGEILRNGRGWLERPP